MAGTPILQAGKTLQLFLRSLPTKSYFNIIGFGSSFSALFPESVLYMLSFISWLVITTDMMIKQWPRPLKRQMLCLQILVGQISLLHYKTY